MVMMELFHALHWAVVALSLSVCGVWGMDDPIIITDDGTSTSSGAASYILKGLEADPITGDFSTINTVTPSSSSLPYPNATYRGPTANPVNATSCASAIFAWLSSSDSWLSSSSAAWRTSVYLTTETMTAMNQEIPMFSAYTTLCDGIPRIRANASISYRATNIVATTVVNASSFSSPDITWTIPQPCTLDDQACGQLWKPYIAYSSSQQIGRAPSVSSPPLPPCTLPSSLESTFDYVQTFASNTSAACGQCTISMGDVQLLYFPVPTTVSRNMCASTPAAGISTLTDEPYYSKRAASNAADANATGPVTAVYQGTTFTSGYAYLSFDSAFARDDCLKEFGNMYTNTYVAVPSSLLSSFRGVDGNAPYSFNFADLNYPVPYSAYNGMNVCEPECSYIQDGAYHPQLSLPPQVKDLDPAWKNCNMAFWGAWDPPIALTPAAVAAVPTPVFGPISGKPEPASTPVTVAKPTSSPNQGVPAHYPQRPSAAQPQASPSKAAAPVAPTPQAPAAHPIISIIQSGAAAQPLPPSDPAPVPPAAPAEAGPLQGLNSAVASVANGAGSPPSYSDPKAASPPQAPAAQEIPPTGPVAEAQQPSNAGSQQPPNAGSQQPPNAGSQQPPNAGSQGAPAPNEAPNEAPVAASAIPAVQLTPVSPADPSTPAAVVIGGSTIREGDPAATIAGTPVSVAHGGVIIGPSTVALPQPGSPEVATNGAAPIASVGGQPISVVPDPASDGQAKGKAGPGQNAVPPVVIGGQAYSAPPPGQPLAIGSVTLQPGGAPATISGQVVSLGSSNLVVGKSTAALMPPDVAASPAATFAVGNSEVVASTGQPLIVGGSTLSAGGSPATVSGHVISVAPSGVAIDGSVVPFTTGGSAANQNSAVFSVNGQTYSAARGAPVMVGSSTLSVGGPAATVSGHVISVAPSGVMVDNVLASYGNAAPSQKSSDGAIFTLDNGLYSASSGQALTIGSATLTAGAPAQTISDHVVSLGSAGVVVDGNTVPYSEIPASGSPPDFTLNGGVYTAPLPGQPLVVGSMTLTSGGPAATLSNGEVVSVGSAGVIIGSSTVPFYTGPGSGASPSTFSVDGHVYTAPASGQSLVIGDETVSLGGPAATLPDGEVVSIGSKGVILGGSSTVPFNTAGRGAPSSETFTIDGHVYTAPSPGQALTIGSITLRSGGPAGTFADGHTVSIGANGVIVGGTSTVPFFTTAANPFAPTFTADGHVYTAPRSGRPLTMGSITLSPGGPAATLSDGEIVSLGPNGVVVDGKTTVPYARSRSTARPGDRVVSAAPTVTDAVSTGPGNSLSTTSGSAQETSSTAAGSGKPRLELETTLVFVLACIAAVLFTRAS